MAVLFSQERAKAVSEGLLYAILGIVGVQFVSIAALWFRLGRLTRAVENGIGCPFGSCPLFTRAQKEAAGERINKSGL
jgi:hypothetical protein